MDIHQNARHTPMGRELLVQRVLREGGSFRSVAREAGVTAKTVRKWVSRYRAQGRNGLQDRSSRPRRSPRATQPALVHRILGLRRQGWTGKRISQTTGVSPATVSRILRRRRLSRARDLEPPRPRNRYTHEAPGDMVHLDIKKLARFHRPGHRVTGDRSQDSPGAGWEFVHVAVDDASRVSYAAVKPDERQETAEEFLREALAYFRRFGIRHVRRILTDRGACYRSRRFRKACRNRGIRHRFTRPYSPQTNGKAERFIQTAINEWAYAAEYASSDQRRKRLPQWLEEYNCLRPHGSLNDQPPISVLGQPGTTS